jgi:colanic acid/amylovoran biosynthesis glycosyltransferase
MKINIVLNNYPSSSETFITSWILGLKERGYLINVLIIDNKAVKIYNHNNPLREILFLKRTSFYLLPDYFMNIFKIKGFKNIVNYSFLHYQSPDIVHFSYSAIAISFLPVLKIRTSVKYVVSCRGTSENIKPYIDYHRKQKLEELFSTVDLIHCVSFEMLNRMKADFYLDDKKSFVNRPAIDLHKFSGEKLNFNYKNIIVITGRLAYVKGLIFAILAVVELKKTFPDIEIRIIGSGPDEEYLKFSIQRLGLGNYVKLLGKLNSVEIRNELLQAKAFLLPSLSEGISNAVLEAMCIGLPVVTTAVGGMSEVIINEKNGILIDSFSIDEIVQGISKILDDENLRNVIIENAKSTIQKDFNLKRLVNVFDVEYIKLVNSR